MVDADLVFHRPLLAKQLAGQILRVAVGSAASSGVFLAAPLRTGKSTFVREDLRPAFEANGALVIYADLWANPSTDPGTVIANAIRGALAAHDGVLMRLAKSAGLTKVNLAGAIGFDLSRIGLGEPVSLSEGLVALSDEVRQAIVLVIDEAQHAITTDAGIAALYALKAARDELNSSHHHGLRVVCTGSNRDKLAMLRNSKDQAFFGAPMVAFPTLQRDFIDWFCHNVELPFRLEADAVWPLFIEADYRPELLGAAADVFRFDFGADPLTGPVRFTDEVRRLADEMNQDQRKVIRSLTPVQLAVLRVMAAAGNDYAPFEVATMEKNLLATQLAGLDPADVTVDVAGILQALSALQDRKLVWKAARGVYAVEEQSVVDRLAEDGLLAGLAPA